MITTHGVARLALLALLLGAAGCREAHADQKPNPKDYHPPPGSPSGSAGTPPPEAAPKVVDGKRPWAPTFDFTLPEGRSDPPTKDEWKDAPEAKEVRRTAPGCEAQRIREWYRITCSGTGWIGRVSGAPDDVSFGCFKTQRDDFSCSKVSVIFPARRGDRRAFELFGWSKWGPAPDTILTEQFLEGDAGPSISIQGLRFTF